MSSTIPQSSSNDVGNYLEHELIQSLPIRPVPDSQAVWHDAELRYTVSMGTVDLSDVLCIEAGTPVEIKGAAHRISNGPGDSQRGRLYIKRDSHRRLLEAEGVYLLAVYDGGILATAWVRSETIDELAGTWTEVDRAHGPVCKLSWARIIPPEIVNGGRSR